MEAPTNENGYRECPGCHGEKFRIARIWGHPWGGGPWGVRACLACKAEGKVTEAEYQRLMKLWGSIPTEEELKELEKGEEWKLP